MCQYKAAAAAANDGEELFASELEVKMQPGHLYIGCFCGPEHYVRHRPSKDLLHTEKCGDVEVVVLLRSRVFRSARASGMQSGPTPTLLWKAVAPVVAECFARASWTIPSLAACKAEEETLLEGFSFVGAAVKPAKRPRV